MHPNSLESPVSLKFCSLSGIRASFPPRKTFPPRAGGRLPRPPVPARGWLALGRGKAEPAPARRLPRRLPSPIEKGAPLSLSRVFLATRDVQCVRAPARGDKYGIISGRRRRTGGPNLGAAE